MSLREIRDELVADVIRRSLRHGRVAHAYLFSGPRGSGKADTAVELAKALNCEHETEGACDQCDSCNRIDNRMHPDIYWLRPESKSRRITVAQIREFERGVNLKPSSAQIKIGLVVDADCMGEEASNAFLKTLEEPPAQTVIILLSAEPQRLLSTILSRCLRVSFGRNEKTKISSNQHELLESLHQYSKSGDSKIVRTYQLLQQVNLILQNAREEIRVKVNADAEVEHIEELDSVAREKRSKQLEARIEGDYRAAREEVLESIYRWFSDLLLCHESVDDSLINYSDYSDQVHEASRKLSYEAASANVDAIDLISEYLTRNIQESLAFEVGLLQLKS